MRSDRATEKGSVSSSLMLLDAESAAAFTALLLTMCCRKPWESSAALVKVDCAVMMHRNCAAWLSAGGAD
eukprot:2920194-Rhodomonas_salina.3